MIGSIRFLLVLALALAALACGDAAKEPSGALSSSAPSASPPAGAAPGPQLELKLSDAWRPAGSGPKGSLFEYVQAPDVQLHIRVRREAGGAAPPEVLMLRLRNALAAQSATRDRSARVTPQGHALVAWSQVVEVGGRRLFTRHWVLVRPAGPDLYRADISLGLPDLWEKQPATAKVIADLQERLSAARIRPGG